MGFVAICLVVTWWCRFRTPDSPRSLTTVLLCFWSFWQRLPWRLTVEIVWFGFYQKFIYWTCSFLIRCSVAIRIVSTTANVHQGTTGGRQGPGVLRLSHFLAINMPIAMSQLHPWFLLMASFTSFRPKHYLVHHGLILPSIVQQLVYCWTVTYLELWLRAPKLAILSKLLFWAWSL